MFPLSAYPPQKLGSDSKLCYVILLTLGYAERAHEWGGGWVASPPLPLPPWCLTLSIKMADLIARLIAE